MNRQFKESVWKGVFRPTEAAAEFENRLRSLLGMTNRYDAARLAIGRSLAESHNPDHISSDTTFGKSIAGEFLFGDDIDLWISAILIEGEFGPTASFDNFRAAVEAHWARGVDLLKSDLDQCAGDEPRFISRLAELLPADGSRSTAVPGTREPITGEVCLKVGAVSETYPANEYIEFQLNGQGTSPHIALMGKVGSGKTTTGIDIAGQIVQKARIPFLMIDPKGEFSDNAPSWLANVLGANAQLVKVGVEPIPLDFLPQPDLGKTAIQNCAMQFRDSIASCCKGAGDIQKDLLRTAIEKAVRRSRLRTLEAIRDHYREELDVNEKRHDSIMSRLNELTSLRCYEPSFTPQDFFGRSWILSLKELGSDELKRLTILLLLDALRFFLLQQNEAPVVNGFRTMRHLLVIDEARRILAEKRYQSLVEIVRQGRSKGSAVMLLSQDPSDFDGQADDFTTQLGSVIAFACSQTQHGLKSLQGVYGRKVQPNEFSDTYLPTGVAFVKLPGRTAERIRCWNPVVSTPG